MDKNPHITKFAILCLFIFNLVFSCFSQTGQIDQNIQDKYWNYRNRFKKHFINYNEIPDFDPNKKNAGRAIPIHQHNIGKAGGTAWCEDVTNNLRGHIKIGDQPEEMGMYLAALALEYRMLKDEGKDTKATLSEIYYIIEALNRMDEKAELFMGGVKTRNGFLVRDDVDDKLRQSFVTESAITLSKEDRLACADAGHYPLPMTQDEIEKQAFSKDHVIDLFLGFSFIHKYMNDAPSAFQPTSGDVPMNINQEVKDYVNRIMSFITQDKVISMSSTEIGNFFTNMNINCTSNIDITMNYVIVNPVTNKVVPRGNNFNIFAYPISNIAKNITGHSWDATPLHIKIDGNLCSNWGYQLLDKNYALGSVNDKVPSIWKNAGADINALLNNGNAIELCDDIIRIVYGNQNFCSNTVTDLSYSTTYKAFVSAYLICSLASQSGTWSQSDVMAFADHYDMWQFDLQYALLNGTSPIKSKSFYENILNSAPCDGPYNYDDGSSGTAGNYDNNWYSSNKWTHPSNPTFNAPDHDANFIGDFAGYDYMFLYNMYRYYYKNQINQNFSEDNSCSCNGNDVIVDNSTNGTLNTSLSLNRKFSNYKNFNAYIKEYISHNLLILNNKTLSNKTDLIICNNSIVTVSNGGILENQATNFLNDSIKIVARGGTQLNINSNGLLDINTNTKVIIQKNAALKASGNNANIIIRNGAKLIVEPGGFLELNNGSKLIVEEGGQVIIHGKQLSNTTNENAVLTFNQGAEIQLKGDNAVLELNGRLHIGDNAQFKFTYPGSNSGYIKFNRGNGWWDNWAPGNAHITCGSNSKINLVGQSKTDRLIVINQNNCAIPKTLAQFTINKGLIEFTSYDAMLESGITTAFNDCTFKGFISDPIHNIRPTRGVAMFGQLVFFATNCDFIDLGTGINAALFYLGNKLTYVTKCNFKNCYVGISTTGAGVSLHDNTFFNNDAAIASGDLVNNSLVFNNTISTNKNLNPLLNGESIGVIANGGNVTYELKQNTINGLNIGVAGIDIDLKLKCNDMKGNSFGLLGSTNSRINMSTLLGGGYNNASNCLQFAHFDEANLWESNYGFNSFKINDNSPCTYAIDMPGHNPVQHCPTITDGSLINFTTFNHVSGFYEQTAEYNFWKNLSGPVIDIEFDYNKLKKIVPSWQSGVSDQYFDARLLSGSTLMNDGLVSCPGVSGGSGSSNAQLYPQRAHPLDDNSNCANITTASFYNKRLQNALVLSMSKMDNMVNDVKINEAADLLTEILKYNYPKPISNGVDKYLLELAYYKLYSCIAQLVENHKTNGGTMHPVPNALQNRFNDLHDVINLRLTRKDLTEVDYKETKHTIKSDRALIYRLEEKRPQAINEIDNILLDNPKTEHIHMYNQMKCVYQTEENAINGTISFDEALVNLKNCNGFLHGNQSTNTSGNARIASSNSPDEVVFGKEHAIAVYPNPTQGSLFIAYDLKEFSTLSFEIFDIQGKRVLTNSLDTNQNALNINNLNLENGVYFYSIYGDGNNLMTKKLVIVK